MRRSWRGCIFCVPGREKPEIAEDNISHVIFLSQILTPMKLTKKHYILLAILCLLIITNPSITAFKAYEGNHAYPERIRRPVNLFIFSEYTADSHRYIGILGNFIDFGWRHNDVVTVDSVVTPKDTLGILVDTSAHPPYPKGFTADKK